MILVVESLFGSRGLSAMLDARRQYQAISADVDRLRAENLRLRYEAKRLREDPAAIEEAAAATSATPRPAKRSSSSATPARPDDARSLPDRSSFPSPCQPGFVAS